MFDFIYAYDQVTEGFTFLVTDICIHSIFCSILWVQLSHKTPTANLRQRNLAVCGKVCCSSAWGRRGQGAVADTRMRLLTSNHTWWVRPPQMESTHSVLGRQWTWGDILMLVWLACHKLRFQSPQSPKTTLPNIQATTTGCFNFLLWLMPIASIH